MHSPHGHQGEPANPGKSDHVSPGLKTFPLLSSHSRKKQKASGWPTRPCTICHRPFRPPRPLLPTTPSLPHSTPATGCLCSWILHLRAFARALSLGPDRSFPAYPRSKLTFFEPLRKSYRLSEATWTTLCKSTPQPSPGPPLSCSAPHPTKHLLPDRLCHLFTVRLFALYLPPCECELLIRRLRCHPRHSRQRLVHGSCSGNSGWLNG